MCVFDIKTLPVFITYVLVIYFKSVLCIFIGVINTIYFLFNFIKQVKKKVFTIKREKKVKK